jgi:hypothetical protein
VAALSAAPLLSACSAFGAPDVARFQPATFSPGTTRPATAPATKRAPKPATAKPEAPGVPKGAVDWSRARTRLGQKATVCGPVVSTRSATNTSGQPTFLNIGAPYPDDNRVTVLIWGENLGHFDEDPESAYGDRKICVTGTVKAYQGAVEIEATRPGQIRVIG